MLASQLIKKLQALINEHGDQETVCGLNRSGYGEPVEDVCLVTDSLVDTPDQPIAAFDLVLSDESSCALWWF